MMISVVGESIFPLERGYRWNGEERSGYLRGDTSVRTTRRCLRNADRFIARLQQCCNFGQDFVQLDWRESWRRG